MEGKEKWVDRVLSVVADMLLVDDEGFFGRCEQKVFILGKDARSHRQQREGEHRIFLTRITVGGKPQLGDQENI